MSQAKEINLSLSNVLVAPLISEKATRLGEKENAIAFWVNPKATKNEIKQAVEAFFPNAKVKSVRTMVKGRGSVHFAQIQGRAKRKKKAYVKLEPGTEINFADFEG